MFISLFLDLGIAVTSASVMLGRCCCEGWSNWGLRRWVNQLGGMRGHQMGRRKWLIPETKLTLCSIEDAFLPWLQQTLDLYLPYLPLISPTFKTIESTVLPPPIYKISPASTSKSVEHDLSLEYLSISSPVPNGKPAPVRVEDQARDKVSTSRTKPDDWVWATFKKNTRITSKDWWQDVREIELEFDDPDT